MSERCGWDECRNRITAKQTWCWRHVRIFTDGHIDGPFDPEGPDLGLDESGFQ